MTDQAAAMLLNISLAAFETVRSEEKPRSARYVKMTKAIDKILEMIDIYRPEAWPAAELSKAGDLVDEMNIRIQEVFGDVE